VPEEARWGDIEDTHMLAAVLGLSALPTALDLLTFQNDNEIEPNGFDDATRRLLIKKYMDLDGEELDSGEFDIKAQIHGCGENFPVDDTSEQLDEAPADDKEDALDRRVELFFFDRDFGVAPLPPGEISRKGSTQYPTWRKNAVIIKDTEVPNLPGLPLLLNVQLLDEAGGPLSLERYVLVSEDEEVESIEGVTDEKGFATELNLAFTKWTMHLPGLDQQVALEVLPPGSSGTPEEAA